MLYPNPFDFNGDGNLDFEERAFQDEFFSGGFDVDDDDDDDEYDSDADSYGEDDYDADWD